MYMKKDRNTSWMAVVLLIIILIVQLMMMYGYGASKNGFHEDEIYTYRLANDKERVFDPTRRFQNEWRTGESFRDALIPDGEERFSIKMVYDNQEADTHPPLYYLIINAICSFTSDGWSKWTGLVPNFVFCLLTTVFVYGIFRQLNREKMLAVLASAACGLSVGMMSYAIFIRMYALKTMLCTALVYIHIRSINALRENGRFGPIHLIWLYLCTLAGIMTHYYTLIFCFFLCGLMTIALAILRRWKNLLYYVLVEIGALASGFVCFTPMYTHLISSVRGKEAYANFASGTDQLSKMEEIFRMLSKALGNGWMGWILLLIVVLLLVIVGIFIHRSVRTQLLMRRSGGQVLRIDLCFSKHFTQEALVENVIYAALTLISLCYILLVVRIAPYVSLRYYACVFPLITSVMVGVLYKAVAWLMHKRRWALVIVSLFVLGISVLSFQMQQVEYVYDDYSLREKALEPYRGSNVIVLNGKSYNSAPEKWIPEFLNYNEIYVCRSREYDNMADAVSKRDLSDGFLVYAYEMNSFDEDGLLAEVRKYMDVAVWEKITDVDCRVYFCKLAGN